MRIIFDIDGPIYDLAKFFKDTAPAYFKKHFNREVVVPDTLDIREMFGLDKSNEEDEKQFKKYIHSTAIPYTLLYPARFDIKELLEQLREDGHEIIFLTKRGNTGVESDKNTAKGKLKGNIVRALSETSFLLNGIIKKGDTVVYCSETTDKTSECEKLQPDLIVEDDQNNALPLSKKWPVLLYDGKYNRNCNAENITRVHNPYETYREIIRIIKAQPKFKELGLEEREKLTETEIEEYNKRLLEEFAYTKFDERMNEKQEKSWVRTIRILAPIFNFVFKPTVVNRDKICYSGNTLYLTNHVSSSDTPIMLGVIKKPAHLLTKIELSKGLLGKLHNSIGCRFVDRKDAPSRKQSRDLITRDLVNGKKAWVYPQGTYSEGIENIHPGTLRSAQIAGSNIQIIGIVKEGKRKKIIVYPTTFKILPTEDIKLASEKVSNKFREIIGEHTNIDNHRLVKAYK